MNINEKKYIVETKESKQPSVNFGVIDVINTLIKMAEKAIDNLTDLQKNQSLTTTKTIDSYIEQNKIYIEILKKPDIDEGQIKHCFDGINYNNSKIEEIKVQDDIRIKEDKEKWHELGKAVIEVIGRISVTAIIVNGTPTIIRAINKK